jgi:hypothetical protein
MKTIRLLLPLLFVGLLFAFSSCDIIDPPYTEGQGNPIDTTKVLKRVLMEEFTGHKCGNCPEASALVHDYKTNLYKDRIVVVSVHAGSLAKPSPPQASSYTTDYRTTEGTELYGFFGLFGVPYGLVDRSNSGELLTQDEWAARISSQLAIPANAEIGITNTFDAGNRKLDVSVTVDFVLAATDQEHLVVCLVEDNIVDWQTDYQLQDPDIPNYTHHDVFRTSLNGTWGEALSSSDIAAGQEITKQYSLTVDPGFDVGNCYVVAYIYDDDTKEVHQVAEAPVLP